MRGPPTKRIKTDQLAANIYINGSDSADIEMRDISPKAIETSGSADVNMNSLYNRL